MAGNVTTLKKIPQEENQMGDANEPYLFLRTELSYGLTGVECCFLLMGEGGRVGVK